MVDGINKFGSSVHGDVTTRPMPANRGDKQLGDAMKAGGAAEAQLAKGAINNAQAVAEDYVNVVADAGNFMIGAGQVAIGVLGAVKDAIDAGIHSLPNIADKLDGESSKLRAKGDLPAHEAMRAERMTKVAANLRAVKEEDAPLVREGLERMAKGVGFAIYDLASMPVDAAQALLDISVAAGITVAKGAIAAGALIGKGLYNAGVAIKDGAVWAGGKVADGAVAVKDGVVWAGGKAAEGAAWAGGKIVDGAIAVKDGAVFVGGKVADGAVAVKDGAVFVGGKVAEGASWFGDLIREGVEDVMIAGGKLLIDGGNAVANKGPRVQLRELQDAPANAR